MLYQNRFAKALLWGGVCTAILTGCSQPANDGAATDNATGTDATAAKTVAITAIVEHPALDAVRKGVIDELAEAGFKEGENLKVNFQSAQGNTATSKLVSKLDGSGTNVTGGSDALPYEPQIELMRQIIPNLKNVGYVYSPGEVNSTIILKNLKEKLTPLGIKVHEAPAQRSTDIAMAARSLEGKVDMIYTSTDNNVVSAYESLFQVAKESKIPLIASDTSSVARGAVAALGVDYYALGRETGKIVVRILNGEKAGEIPVYTPQKLDLFVSPKNALAEGITLPQAIIDKAKEVVE